MTSDHTPPADRAAIRAEAFRDAANGAYLNVHSAAAEGVRRWLLALADGELRRMADEAQPALCVECDHPKDAHREGDAPVSPGRCASCTDDFAWHNFEPASTPPSA